MEQLLSYLKQGPKANENLDEVVSGITFDNSTQKQQLSSCLTKYKDLENMMILVPT